MTADKTHMCPVRELVSGGVIHAVSFERDDATSDADIVLQHPFTLMHGFYTPASLCRLITPLLPITAQEKVVLMNLLDQEECGVRMNRTYADFGRMLGCSTHSVQRALCTLRRLGLVASFRVGRQHATVSFTVNAFIRWAERVLGVSSGHIVSEPVIEQLPADKGEITVAETTPGRIEEQEDAPAPAPDAVPAAAQVPAAATPSVVGKPVPVAPLPVANTVAHSPAPTTQPEMPQITTPEVIDWHDVPDEEVLPPSPYIKALLEREKAGERLPQKEFDEVTEYVIACEQERMNREHPTEWYYNSNLTPPPGVTGSPMKGWHWDPASGYPCPHELEMAWGPEVDASEERNATIALAGKTSEGDEFSSGTDTDETDIGHGVVCNPDL